MTTSFDATAEFPLIAAQIKGAAEELEEEQNRNHGLARSFAERGWSDLVERVRAADTDINGARDALMDVAEKIGMAEIVREARRKNRMVGSRESLGREHQV